MAEKTTEEKNELVEDSLARVEEDIQEKVQACIQCGTCTGSCSSAFAMDLTPRQMWRLVQLGQLDEVLHSKTFFLCSACYYCTLRCPRGLPLTETIGALKRLASAKGIKNFKESINFYRTFMETVRRYGRVRELEFMNRYFLSMRNPLFPLRFTSMGLKLIGKGKVPLQVPRLIGEGKFDRLFRKVKELEERA
ncbi:MAG: 4Fe-4S dicluster domain-containing protein [Deltaproteobacteria bacterium]|nr:4Fe-4S dicluster domain-containing protein [Deltaproteobacteria bacterium]MBW2137980.1 4Fe-4S dicluster domain-containing protein [Deltaproteobacteria bacterium]